MQKFSVSGGILRARRDMDPYTGDEELDALVRERMDTLAEPLKRIFDDPASSIYIESFSSSATLNADQTDALKHEIILMMLGFTDPKDFSFILMTELEMPPRQAFAVEHWVKGVFLKDVMPLIEPEETVAAPVAQEEQVTEKAGAVIVSPLTREVPQSPPVPEFQPEPEPEPEPFVVPAPVFSEPIVTQSVVPVEVFRAPIAPPLPAIPVVAPAVIPPQPQVSMPAWSPAIIPSAPAPSFTPPVAPVMPAAMPKLPPLPKTATPLPLPVRQVPAVPSVTSPMPVIDLTKLSPRPHTMFDDVLQAKGAITPAGIARYDKPLIQTPAYAK